MEISRRAFLMATGGVVATGLLSGMARREEDEADAQESSGEAYWEEIRAQFELDPRYIHLAGLLMASNPRPIRQAIAAHRRNLDANPALFAEEYRLSLELAVRHSAARYLGVDYEGVALTDSTTMGLGLIYNGLQVGEDQEMLSTGEDYYATHQALRHKSRDSGARLRVIELFENAFTASQDEIVDTLVKAIRPQTRLLALTWVHSKTGLKLPVKPLAEALAEINAGRDDRDRVLLGLDGVHGLGVENVVMDDLGCDFFMAGTHKWLLGPRGTGIAWGRRGLRSMVNTLIPTFTPDGTWGGRMTPGGFKPFEHQWALAAAFDYHRRIGKDRIAGRIHALSRQCKEELAKMHHVTLRTPLDSNLSSGIVCFDVDGLTPQQVVSRLLERGVIASTTPYTPTHARLTPGIFNTHAEIDAALAAIREMG